MIACVSPDDRRRRTIEGAEDAMEIISFSDHMGFNANWQLGYGKLISKRLTEKEFTISPLQVPLFFFFFFFCRTPNQMQSDGQRSSEANVGSTKIIERIS